MVIDMGYWTKVLKRLFWLTLTITFIYLSFRLAIFYMPFLIAFIISLIIEPVIKFLTKKTNLNRKTSAIIVLFTTFAIIIGILVVGITTIISESSNLLQALNGYVEKMYNQIQQIVGSIDFDKIKLSDKVSEILNSTSQDFLQIASAWISNILNKVMQSLTKLPAFFIYIGITLISTYFICTDKLYILDQIEHHLPRTWVKRLMVHIRGVVNSLGCYLKAQFILAGISFIVTLIRIIYNKIYRNECRISFTYSNCNRFRRCFANTWFWYCDCAMGSNFSFRWKYKPCHSSTHTTCSNFSCKATHRTQNSKQTNRYSSNLYINCNVYRI